MTLSQSAFSKLRFIRVLLSFDIVSTYFWKSLKLLRIYNEMSQTTFKYRLKGPSLTSSVFSYLLHRAWHLLAFVPIFGSQYGSFNQKYFSPNTG